jgi:hypothetical protein
VNRGVHAEKALGRSRRLEALHLALSSLDRLMRVLGRIVLAQGRCHMWTPPSGKGFLERFCSRSGCSHMSGLFARRTWPLALMKSAEQVPFAAASFAL